MSPQPNIIVDPEALSPSYVPERLLHREDEQTNLLENLRNRVNTFICGPCGSGKTSLAKRVVAEFNETSKGKVVYIDCSLYQTTNSILRELLSDLNIPCFSRSNYDLTRRLREKTRKFGLTICLDHFEHLKDVEVV